MTMFPPSTHHHHQNRSSYRENRCYGTTSYGGYLNQSFFGTHNNLLNCQEEEGNNNYCSTLISSDLINHHHQVMAEEDESRSETDMSTTHHDLNIGQQEEEAPAGSSSRDLPKDPPADEEEGVGWLQLSIGSHAVATTTETDYHNRQRKGRREDLVELGLLPNSSSGAKTSNFSQETVRSPAAASSSTRHQQQQQPQYYCSPVLPPRPTNLFLQQYYYPPQLTNTSSNYPLNPNYHHQPEDIYQDYNNNWAFRSLSSSSSSLMPPVASRLPFQLHGAAGVDIVHHLPRLDFRVVDPPRRPHSGIWFTLQASQIQAKEPFLPQIPKSYLRIKDRRMTIRVIIKYLVNKLRLDSESEIEIRCRGQQLLPFLTLQHVRDSIWNPRDSSSFSTSADQLHHHHLMVLHYGRLTSA